MNAALLATLREAGGDLVASAIEATGRAPMEMADEITAAGDVCYLDCIAREYGHAGMPSGYTGSPEWAAVFEGVREALARDAEADAMADWEEELSEAAEYRHEAGVAREQGGAV